MGTVHTLTRRVEILTLALSGDAFAMEANIVSEILDLVPITVVPNAPAYATGLINVRGKVVPLVDLRVRFGMVPEPPTIDTRVVVIKVQLDGEPTLVGLLADKVYEVTEIDLQGIEAAPKVGMSWPAEFIRGISRRNGDFLIVLDIDRVFAAEEARDERLHAT